MDGRSWLVVADEAIVKVFEHPSGRVELTDVQQFTDPAAHARWAAGLEGDKPS